MRFEPSHVVDRYKLHYGITDYLIRGKATRLDFMEHLPNQYDGCDDKEHDFWRLLVEELHPDEVEAHFGNGQSMWLKSKVNGHVSKIVTLGWRYKTVTGYWIPWLMSFLDSAEIDYY